MNRGEKLLINTFILGIGTIIPKLVNFIVLPLLTAYLTKSEYGSYDLITTMCFLFVPFVTLQIQTGAFRFLIEAKNNLIRSKTIITNIFAYIIPVSLMSVCVLFFALYRFDLAIRMLISAYFFIEILYQVAGQIIRGMSYNKVYSLASIFSAVSNMISIILFVWLLKWGLIGVLLSLIISVSFPTLQMIVSGKILDFIDISLIRKDVLTELLKYSWPMVPNSMSMWIMNASDRLVITYFLGIEANAIYAVAKKIPNILTIVQGTFTMAWHESASIASSDDDVSTYYSNMFDTVIRLMSGMMIVIIVFLPLIFNILIRGDYQESYVQIPIILLAMFFYSICSYLGGIYVAQKKTFNVGITTVVSAAVNLIICLLFVQKIGLFAASISTLVSYIFLAFYRMFNVRKFVKIKYNYKIIFLIVVALFILTYLGCLHSKMPFVIECAFGIPFAIIINRHYIVHIARYVVCGLRH